MKPEEYVIEKDKFVFADPDRKISDKELATKPVGYFKDALNPVSYTHLTLPTNSLV